MLKDFRQFLLRGNVVDLAVGIVIGAAFGEPTPDPTTKKCPECLSEIPIDARRCAFCTTEQPAAA